VTVKNTALCDLATFEFLSKYQRNAATDSFSLHFSGKQPSLPPPTQPIHLGPEIDDGSFIRNIVKCSSLKVNRRFDIQVRRISQGSKQYYLPTCFMLVSYVDFLWPWSCRGHIPPRLLFTYNGIHVFITQKIKLFNSGAVTNLEYVYRINVTAPLLWDDTVTRYYFYFRCY
jgi:hypothetical protein